MREGKKKMSLQPVFAGILGTQEALLEDQMRTSHSVDHQHSQQGSWSRGSVPSTRAFIVIEARRWGQNISSGRIWSQPQEKVREQSHKSHESLKELWDCRQL